MAKMPPTMPGLRSLDALIGAVQRCQNGENRVAVGG